MVAEAEKSPEPRDLVGSIGRSITRLRETRLDLQTQPLREMRLEMQIVFFAIKTPIAGGRTLRIPTLVMLRRVGSSEIRPAVASAEKDSD
ncbi:MAG TPA: hypothetical protein VGC05_22265 [Mycobacterium sp.]